jgi:hypothetical protein
MKLWVVFLCMLFVPSLLSTQVRTDSAKSADTLGNDKQHLTKALVGSVTLIESDTKTEFLFVPKKRDASLQTSATWTFGNKPLKPQESHSVEIQVGEYLGKPVFLPLRLPREVGDEGMEDAIRLLTEAIGENSTILGQFKAQGCIHGKKSVKTCKDENGKSFCCRYICASTPQ